MRYRTLAGLGLALMAGLVTAATVMSSRQAFAIFGVRAEFPLSGLTLAGVALLHHTFEVAETHP